MVAAADSLPYHTAMRWLPPDIVDAVAAGLKQHAAEEDEEQVVYGFDCRDELGLHPLIQQAIQSYDFGVWPEQRYPSDWNKTRQSEGKRCDIVLTEHANTVGLRDARIRGTLFDTPDAVDPEQAYWLEVKTVAQYESEGPFKGYSKELLSPVADDVKKLWSDALIFNAGLLLILFTETKEVAEHDLVAWHRRCLDRGYPVAVPAVRGFAIRNRVGNGWCAIALFGVRGV